MDFCFWTDHPSDGANLRITHTRTYGTYPSLAKTPSPPYCQPLSCRLDYATKANRKPAIKTDSTDPMVRALAATPNTVAGAFDKRPRRQCSHRAS